MLRLNILGSRQITRDGFAFVAHSLRATPSGFRIRWHAAERRAGHSVHDSTTDVSAPWGAETHLPSVAGYRISVFYAPKTADEYFTREDLTK